MPVLFERCAFECASITGDKKSVLPMSRCTFWHASQNDRTPNFRRGNFEKEKNTFRFFSCTMKNYFQNWRVDWKERGSSNWINIVFLKMFNYQNVIRKFVTWQFLILTMVLGPISRWIILLYWEKVLKTKRQYASASEEGTTIHTRTAVLYLNFFMPIVTKNRISSSQYRT